MAAEVSLAPNLLSLYRCQSLYCLHIAKTPTPGTEIRRIRSTSGQHSSWHLYLPNRPDVLLVKRVSQASTSLSAQPPGRTSLPMGTHKLSITNHFSQKSRRRTKLSLGSSVRRLFMPVLYSGISIQCLNLQPSGIVSGSLSK